MWGQKPNLFNREYMFDLFLVIRHFHKNLKNMRFYQLFLFVTIVFETDKDGNFWNMSKTIEVSIINNTKINLYPNISVNGPNITENVNFPITSRVASTV